MRDQTARGSKFPTACARCGGRISEPVAFCPHCGAHARFALAGGTPHEQGAQVRANGNAGASAEPTMRAFEPADFEGDLDTPWPGPPSPLFASPAGEPYADTRAPAWKGSRGWGVKGGTGLILGAFVVLYGGAVILHRYDQQTTSPIRQESATKSVQGSIVANGTGGAPADSGLRAPAPVQGNATTDPAQMNGIDANHGPPSSKLDDSIPPDMSIANLPPPRTQAAPQLSPTAPAAPAQAQRQPGPPPAAVTSTAPSDVDEGAVQGQPNGPTATQGRSFAQGKFHGRTRNRVHANARRGDTTYLHVDAQPEPEPQAEAKGTRVARAAANSRTLDGIQARLAKNNLSGARASLAGVLATDPNNSYALSLREQLVSREQARDASLNAARACVVQSRWHCVWHNAGSALSIDASSTEAKALVDRAIIESGAATAPAGPGPDNVQVPMVQ